MPLADFHLHTVCSNDAYMEMDLIAPAALAAGVVALAATDHDRVAAVKPLRERCRAEGLGFLSGVEVDCDDDTGRFGHVHILGFGFDEDDRALNEILRVEVDSGRERLYAGLKLLEKERGFDLDVGGIQAWWDERVPYRELGSKSIADCMAAKGVIARDEAKELIDDAVKRATTEKHVSPPCPRVIETIHDAGGLAVLAHPKDMPREGILQFVEWGIDGMEVYHVKGGDYVEHLRPIAEELGLAMTGGGDWHGKVQELEPGTWPSPAPGELYEKLVERCRERFGREPR